MISNNPLSTSMPTSPAPGFYASIIIALVIGTMSTQASAGPWTKSLGEGYAKVSQGWYHAQGIVNDTGALIDDGSAYSATTTSFYSEVGVARQFQLQLYVPYTVAYNTDAGGNRFLKGGLGDSTLGAQWGLSQKIPFAIRSTVKMPLEQRVAPKTDLEQQFPASSDGQVDVTLWLSLGQSLHPKPIYYFVEAGYLHRTDIYFGDSAGVTNYYSDAWVFTSQFGYQINPRIGVSANLNGRLPFEEEFIQSGALMLGLGVYVRLGKKNNWAVELNIDRSFWEKNEAPALSANLGLAYSY
jgi:hypothetical protein